MKTEAYNKRRNGEVFTREKTLSSVYSVTPLF